MRTDIMGAVARDLLSTPPLIFRLVRHNLIKTTLVDMNPELKMIHVEIMHVLQDEGRLHVAEIGEKLQIARAQMTHLIDKLVEMQIVERQMNQADRRTLDIDLTEKGKDLLEEHENSTVNAVREYLSSLTEEELARLSSSLRNLREILCKL
jgi:DNA-binding MarR family transcriptional regulator